MSSKPIRVLVVDDSALVRRFISSALQTDPAIEVVGLARDPYEARDMIEALKPDLLTLDLEMPRMDGLTFLRILMQKRPLPVIIISSLTQRGSAIALDALQIGAFDVLAKPAGSMSFGNLGPDLIARVKAAMGAGRRSDAPTPPPLVKGHIAGLTSKPRDVILLGASTGGTTALTTVLTRLPSDLPGIAIVQHIPPVFSKAFADRLNQICAMEVREAVDGDQLHRGLALIAPGNFHLVLQWEVTHYRVRLNSGQQLWHQRPAVDVLFASAVDCGAAPHALAGVLTGMGRDGAQGLLRLRTAGARTFSQDEPSSVVYGMPKVAWELGGSERQLPLDRMADYIVNHSSRAYAAGDKQTSIRP